MNIYSIESRETFNNIVAKFSTIRFRLLVGLLRPLVIFGIFSVMVKASGTFERFSSVPLRLSESFKNIVESVGYL